MSGRTPAWLGLFMSLVFLGLLAVPYLLIDGSEVSVYYGVGPVSPLYLAVLPVVTVVALLGGARGRSDPITAAGAGLAVSTLLGVLVAMWALEASTVVGGIAVDATFDRHRFALLGAAIGLIAMSGWFARAALSGHVPQGP